MELYAKRKSKKSDKIYKITKNTILTVIVSAMLIMILFTLFNFITTPEFLVKRKIQDITADYYENYFYDSVPDHNALEAYTKYGLARLPLRQLLLFDDQKHAAATDSLKEYCDLDKTSITIYPEPPFGRNNYHVEYTYSCKF